MDLTLESGVKLLLHSWGVATVMDGDEVQGLIFESKSGRQAILAGVTIDTTGDGDVFALAGAEDGEPVAPPLILTTNWAIMGPIYFALVVIFTGALIWTARATSSVDLNELSRGERG
jgi:hypothetical protein